MIKKFITTRLEERTSLDGAILIGVGIIVLIAGPFAKLAAYGAIAYGAWTIWKKENTLAVINWTWGLRYDFFISGVEKWTTLGLSCVPSKLEPLIGLPQAEKVLEFYNTYAGKSILWDRWRSLQTIYTSQQFLKLHNIKSVQTYMDYMLWDTEHHCPDYIKILQDLTKTELYTFEGKNFLDWSYDHGFEVTEEYWHPLEDAHKAASKLWLNTYQGVLNND